MCIRNINATTLRKLFYQKDDERNLISATFHMTVITLISMSLGDLPWFVINTTACVPYLTLGQFFWFGYGQTEYKDYYCLDSTIVNMMRIIILLSFMAIIFCLIGFFMDITGTKSLTYYRMFRRYSVAGICSSLFIMTIITMSYCIIMFLQETIGQDLMENNSISAGLGFYLLAFAGGVQSLGVLYNLILPYKSSEEDDIACILDGFDDSNRFQNLTPPPPYSLPPPPYTP
ncbi:hypothetical protein ABEB36_004534 [Hypothenemus hampei]|uniref:Transmembrane protein 127 transmembrane region domain-containing protein n=1 Tax=Hypothenemus hampei TaxID=57062 RepID=A0ABD1F3S3_HYPHA